MTTRSHRGGRILRHETVQREDVVLTQCVVDPLVQDVPAVDLEKVRVEDKILRLVPEQVAMKHRVLPLRKVGRTLTVAMANPTDMGAIDNLKFITRYEIEPVVVGETVIVPVTKISFGFGAGGGKGGKGGKADGGSGTGGGASVEPIAFIVIRNGKAQLLPLEEKGMTVAKLLEYAPDVVKKVKEFREKREKKKAQAASDEVDASQSKKKKKKKKKAKPADGEGEATE